MVNDGPLEGRLIREAKRLGVSERVHFLGQLPRDEYMEMLQTSAGAVFTGLREEGGLALAEALAAGVPVVVLGIGGAQLIAAGAEDPERTRVIEPGPLGDVVSSIARAMREIQTISRPARRPNFDFESARREYRSIARTAVSGARSSARTDLLARTAEDRAVSNRDPKRSAGTLS